MKKNKNNLDVFVEKPELNELDLEMISTNISNPKKDYKNIIYDIIFKLCSNSKEKKTDKKNIIKIAKKFNIDVMRVEDSIERLKRLRKIKVKNDLIFIE